MRKAVPRLFHQIISGSWSVESFSGTERSQNPTHPNNPFNPWFLMPIKAHGASNKQERHPRSLSQLVVRRSE